jgi:hypothetical protein
VGVIDGLTLLDIDDPGPGDLVEEGEGDECEDEADEDEDEADEGEADEDEADDEGDESDSDEADEDIKNNQDELADTQASAAVATEASSLASAGLPATQSIPETDLMPAVALQLAAVADAGLQEITSNAIAQSGQIFPVAQAESAHSTGWLRNYKNFHSHLLCCAAICLFFYFFINLFIYLSIYLFIYIHYLFQVTIYSLLNDLFIIYWFIYVN